jgi:hypothetical protein
MANLEDDLHAVFSITCGTLKQAGFTQLKTCVTRRLTYNGDGQKDGVSHPGRRADVTWNCPYDYLAGDLAKNSVLLLDWWIRDDAIYRNGDLSLMQQDPLLQLRLRNVLDAAGFTAATTSPTIYITFC